MRLGKKKRRAHAVLQVQARNTGNQITNDERS